MLNAATALAQAYSDSIPVLLVAPGMPLHHPGLGNGELHETKDLGAAMGGIVAASHRVASVEEIPAGGRAGVRAHDLRPAAPVHLEIPLDLLAAEGEADAVAPVFSPPLVADPAALDAAAALLARAERPLVLAGGGAAGAAAELRRVAERLGAPVVCSINGKGTLDEHHPLSMGASYGRAVVAELAADADAVLVVGSELAPSDLWLGPLAFAGRSRASTSTRSRSSPNVAPRGGRRRRCGAGAGGAGRTTRPAAAAGGERARRALAQRLPRRRGSGRRALGRAARRDRRRARRARRCGGRQRDGLLLRRGRGVALPAPALLPLPDGLRHARIRAARRDRRAARPPGDRVLALAGDGGVLFSVAELAAAAQERLALPVVVVDNSGYGEIRNEMRDRGDIPLGVDFPGLDFAALGRAFNCHGEPPTSPDDIRAALERAFAADRPTVSTSQSDRGRVSELIPSDARATFPNTCSTD